MRNNGNSSAKKNCSDTTVSGKTWLNFHIEIDSVMIANCMCVLCFKIVLKIQANIQRWEVFANSVRGQQLKGWINGREKPPRRGFSDCCGAVSSTKNCFVYSIFCAFYIYSPPTVAQYSMSRHVPNSTLLTWIKERFHSAFQRPRHACGD